MQNTGKPSNAAARAGEAKYGGSGNSFAVQRTAAQRAANATQASAIENDARNAEIQRVLAMRQSYMGMPGGQDNQMAFSRPPSMPGSVSDKSFGNPNPGLAGGMGGMMGGNAMSFAKGVDNFLGGAGSQLLGNLGQNLGNGIGRMMTSPANPLSGLFSGPRF